MNWGCMKFPCSRKDIDRFEEDNQGLICVNVYKLLNESTNTDRITKVRNAEHQIHLLMFEKEDGHHYVVIKDISKLVGCQYNKHKEKKQICPHCLRGFQSIDTFKKENILNMVVQQLKGNKYKCQKKVIIFILRIIPES